MSKVRLSDIRLPPRLIKDLDLETLRSINSQDDATFFEFFQGLDLPDVSSKPSSFPRDRIITVILMIVGSNVWV